MKWVRNYRLFKESKEEKISYKNLVGEICTAMVLLNNEFLDNVLDRGLKARYSDNSNIFITDLKNLLLAKNRLMLGKFEGDRCVEDTEISKVNNMFENMDFDIEKNWNMLVSSRTIARNIIDKLLPNEKLDSELIRYIFWVGPNRNSEHKEDIVIELKDDSQFSFFLNKSLSTSKTSSFNLFADDLIGDDIDRLFKDDFLSKWDKLTQEWIKLIYENSNKNIQQYIEKFIDPKRIETIGYFEYFDIRHKDPKFKYLGEFIKDFDKNILKFQDLMSEIWKKRELFFMDSDRVFKEWMETKIVILNSRILEHLLTTSLKSNHIEDIKKLDNGWKLAGGTVKMKIFKTLVEKIGCLERPVYFLGRNGDDFTLIPSREFFRKNYDDLKIKFDYHVNFAVSDVEENNDFKIKIKLELDDDTLINMDIVVKFTGSEMSGKLSAKYKFEISDNFNYLISTRIVDDGDESN